VGASSRYVLTPPLARAWAEIQAKEEARRHLCEIMCGRVGRTNASALVKLTDGGLPLTLACSLVNQRG